MDSSKIEVDSSGRVLEDSGWVLIEGLKSIDSAQRCLKHLGRLVP